MPDPVAHAKAYPFPAPDRSFLYEDGRWTPLNHPVDIAGRYPVLAAGSNQSPEQLARKYGAIDDIGPIPAQRGVLHDFDVVYAAHLSSYGSVPATFQKSTGTRVTVFVLWLTGRQLDRMHETEGNYTYDHLEALCLDLDGGTSMIEAYAYTSKIGCLSHDGACVSLAEINAQHRRFPALAQADIQAVIRDRLAPGMALDTFIDQHISDRSVHRERSTRLADDAVSVAYTRRIIAEL